MMVKILTGDSTTGTELTSQNVWEVMILGAHGRPKGKRGQHPDVTRDSANFDYASYRPSESFCL